MTLKAGSPLLKVAPTLLRTLLGITVLGVGIGIAYVLYFTKPEPPRKEGELQLLTVATVPATLAEVPRRWLGYGTVRTMNAVELSAQVSARVTERPRSIEPGVTVESGDLIVQLELTDFTARAEAADQLVAQATADLGRLDIDESALQTQLELAEEQASIERQELQRALDAIERGASNTSEMERRKKSVRIVEREVSTIRQQLDAIPSRRAALSANLKRLAADATLAHQNLARTTITSPIAGVVQRVDVEQGELLAIGSRVARIVDISRVEVPLKIPASALGYVKIGDSAVLRPDGPSSQRWSGAVARISPEADPGTRTLTVFVEVEQDPSGFSLDGRGTRSLLLPGQFVTCDITGDPESGRLVLPRRAVQDGVVFIAEPTGNGSATARRRMVEVLFHMSGEFPEIDQAERQWSVLADSSILPGTPIIVTNLDSMTDGRFIDYEHRAVSTEANR